MPNITKEMYLETSQLGILDNQLSCSSGTYPKECNSISYNLICSSPYMVFSSSYMVYAIPFMFILIHFYWERFANCEMMNSCKFQLMFVKLNLF